MQAKPENFFVPDLNGSQEKTSPNNYEKGDKIQENE